MLFQVLTFLLIVLAALFVIVPLWRDRHKTNIDTELRKEANVALFHERAEDLKAEFETGSLGQVQFDALITELQQNLLADVEMNLAGEASLVSEKSKQKWEKRKGKEKREQVNSPETDGLFSLNVAVPLVLLLLVPILAYSLYERWGFLSDVEMMSLYQRTVDNRDDLEEAQSLIVSLGEAAQENEDQPWTWYFLAENFANLGMFNEAEISYLRSSSLLNATPEKALVLGRVAMAMYINAELQFTPQILEIIAQARAINPNEISILQLLATDAAENEDYESAIQYWRLLIQASPNSAQADQLRLNIAAAQQVIAEQNPDAASGPIININVSLANGLQLNENLRVFVAARNADREGMPPLAATSLVVANLPLMVQLDDSLAVGPFDLSSAENVFVSALVSYAGTATPQRGDYRVVSDTFSHNSDLTEVNLIISEQVK
jgi:cytochrome c-type biogenesis protein CcmH